MVTVPTFLANLRYIQVFPLLILDADAAHR